jgi:hypothetical protein
LAGLFRLRQDRVRKNPDFFKKPDQARVRLETIEQRKPSTKQLTNKTERNDMNSQFDELVKGLAQSTSRRGALKKFVASLAGVALASLGLANTVEVQHAHKKFKCQCRKPPYWGCTTQECFAACALVCV